MTSARVSRRAAALVASLVLGLGPAGADWPELDRQSLFERVFGDLARFEPDIVATVLALPPGERLLRDTDGDGRPDEAWYVDTDPRSTIRPILVRAVDEDGDLPDTERPDLDSDLYLYDWRADASVDVVTDYVDEDGDDDLDEVGMYSWQKKMRGLEKPGLMLWWSRDLPDRNLLWHTVSGTYYQNLCQYRSAFTGDGIFSAFALVPGAERWVPLFENPFTFYDPDRDGCAEITVRIEGMGADVDTLRYSFDADGDAFGRRAYDYEFSVSARSAKEPARQVKLGHAGTFTTKIRGIPTGRLLSWEGARSFAEHAPWASACLTWDELNANCETDDAKDPHERWEGVIAPGSEHFAQVGGPPCSELNKRQEISLSPARPLGLYFDSGDHRLHLRGASEGWLRVDYDLDGDVDAMYTYADDNADGILDRRVLDMDADGAPEAEFGLGRGIRPVPLEYDAIHELYAGTLLTVLDASQAFCDAARTRLRRGDGAADPVVAFYRDELPLWHTETRLGERVRGTPGGTRYYMDLIRDRLFIELRRAEGDRAGWGRIEAAYAAGDYALAARLIGPSPERAPAGLPLRVTNRSPMDLEHHPVSVPLSDLGDLANGPLTVTAPGEWICPREAPCQTDTLDPTVGPELTFLADIPKGRTVTYYVRPSRTEPRHTARTAVSEWPRNVGWESTFGAYRWYDGQLDFFGRPLYAAKGARLDRLIYPVDGVDYHTETDWGLDALHVGATSGLGGLTLYEGSDAHPIQNPLGTGEGAFRTELVASGPVRAAVRVTAEGFAPGRDVRATMLYVIYAEHQECEARVRLHGATEDASLAPGLVKLAEERAILDARQGIVGSWGRQEDAIGEIGLGLIVPPFRLASLRNLPKERRVLCPASGGELARGTAGPWGSAKSGCPCSGGRLGQ